jgi:type II secretory ATPase GspE/PulE/Tfp pilus assembly ATPase PilB-like protein
LGKTRKGLPAGAHPALDNLKLGKPVGCDACHHFGYQGRISIMEQLEITSELEDLIAHGTAATTAAAIEQAAVQNGMVTILQDGITKVIENRTTLEEVLTQVGE